MPKEGRTGLGTDGRKDRLVAGCHNEAVAQPDRGTPGHFSNGMDDAQPGKSRSTHRIWQSYRNGTGRPSSANLTFLRDDGPKIPTLPIGGVDLVHGW
jgi:hypothetical protein